MYSVSDAFKTAAASNAQRHYIRGHVDGRVFSGSNVIKGSVNIRNQFCPATAIELGGVYIGQLAIEFTSQFADVMNIRGQWKGKTISIEIGLELDDSNVEWIPAPSGYYIIDDATWTETGLKIKAYDNMSKFDKPLSMDQTNGTLYDLLSLACLQCGVTLGMSQSECEALTNGSMQISAYPGHSMETYRDMISELATMACTFATIDRSGRLVLCELPSQVIDTIDASHRVSGATFSDFASFYTALIVTNMEDNSVDYYMNDNVNGLSMDIGANPFLQYGTKPVVELMRSSIIRKLGQFRATPFSVAVLTNPAYDLGDLIRFTGGIGGGSIGCVMSYDLKVDFMSVSGYGENPAAAAIVTDLAKEVSAQRQTASQRYSTIYHGFVNSSDLTIGQEEEDILRIRFVASDTANIQIWHELKMENEFTSSDQKLTLRYYLDGEEIEYFPEQTFGEEGVHTFNTLYWLKDVLPGVTHTWEVTAQADSGQITIDRDNLRASLYGQGLVASADWDGYLEFTDSFALVQHTSGFFNYEDGEVRVDMAGNDNIVVSDDFSLRQHTHGMFNYAEEVDVITKNPEYSLYSADYEFQIFSSDGEFYIDSSI